MPFSNALPRGEIQGEVAVIETRRLTLDGHGSTIECTTYHTHHSLIAHAELCLRLAKELQEAQPGGVVELKRHG